MKRILLVEDDPGIAEHILTLVQPEGISLYLADSAVALKELLDSRENFSIIILDRLLGSFDTRTLMPEIRKKWPKSPTLILSAINTPQERAELINLGADDYLGKPFLGQELMARIKALDRRSHVAEENYVKLGNVILSHQKRIVSVGEKSVTLTGKEYLVFRTLLSDLGRVYSRNELLDHVWGTESDLDSNVLEATITSLRKRLENLSASPKIKNLRNVGYWVEE